MYRLSVLLGMTATENMSHDCYVSLVWRLLQLGNVTLATELHDRAKNGLKYMPFVWSLQSWGTGANLLFSSHREEITEVFAKGVQLATGTAEIIDNQVIEIKKMIPIRDASVLMNQVTVKSLSPIVVSYPNPRQPSGKRLKRNILFGQDKEAWFKQVASNLEAKTEAFCGIRPLVEVKGSSSVPVVTPYKGKKVFGETITLSLSSNIAEGIQIALYNGLGELNGSGFGMVSLV